MRTCKERACVKFWFLVLSCVAASLVLALPLFAEDTDDNGRTEEYWRQRAEKFRTQIRYQEENITHYREQERICEERGHSRTYGECQSRYQGRIKDAETLIEGLKNNLELLADEARKAGAQPGWIRE